MYVGWYGNLTITNLSQNFSLTFTLDTFLDNVYINTLIESTILEESSPSISINVPIYTRLTNRDVVLTISYSTSGENISVTTETGISIEFADEEYIKFIVNSAFRHNGTIALEVDITN